jgi:hypothetical protein
MDVTLINTLKERFNWRGNRNTGAAFVTPVDANGDVIGSGSTVVQDIVIEGVANVTEQQAQSVLLNSILAKLVAAPSTAAHQAAHTLLLESIQANTTGLVKNDKEVPFMSWKAIQAFTDVLVGDIVVTYGVLATETLVLTTHTKRWRGALDVVIPGDINDYLVPLSGNPISLAQMQSLGLATTANQVALNNLIGEVAANPTQYTLLERIKSLEAAVVGTRTVKTAIATATGVISTQNTVPLGDATDNSAVEIPISGEGTLSIQVTGTYTGALSVQATNDSVWVTLRGACLLNKNTGATSATIASTTQGLFSVDCSGFSKIRVTALAAVTGSVTVSLKAVETTSLVALDAPLPPGANNLGNITTVSTVIAITPLGAMTDTAATADTGTFSINALIKRGLARWTTLFTLLPANLGTGGGIKIDGSGTALPVSLKVTTVSDGSGTITSGGTPQNALAAAANGYNYLIQNNSNADLWFSTLATAEANSPSIRLPAGAVYETPDSLKVVGALSVFGASTGQAFTIRKWG